jgi:hypothetical protein
MPRIATGLDTRLGVLRLVYKHPEGLALPSAEMYSSISVVNLLHAASIRIVESGPEGIDLPDLINSAAYLQAPYPATSVPPWIRTDTLFALIQGGQALETPVEPRKPPPRAKSRSWWARVLWIADAQDLRESRASADRALAVWAPADATDRSNNGGLDLPLARVSYESPFELVVVISLSTSSAVTAFAILIRALRLAYRNVRGFELDDAQIDAEIATLRAYQSEREADQALAESRLLRVRAVHDTNGAPHTIRAKRGLDLDSAQASIEDG